MSKATATGWAIMLAGTALWIYGFLSTGNPALIDWPAHAPWWIADCLPNVQAEIGMVVMIAAMVPMYWPARR